MKSLQRSVLAVAAVTLLFLTFVSVASAHHARAGQYGSEIITLEGVVTQFRWKNPHVIIFFDVRGADGVVQQWAGELSSINTMLSAGMSRGSVAPGDEIVVVGTTHQYGKNSILPRSIDRTDGTLVLAPGEEGGRFTDRTRGDVQSGR